MSKRENEIFQLVRDIAALGRADAYGAFNVGKDNRHHVEGGRS